MAKIYRSTVINAPVAKVWGAIRDFNALPQWVPALGASEIEGGQDSSTVGCIRNMKLAEGGAVVRERLLTLSDRDYQCTYSILEAPLPIRNYVATLKLTPITDGDRTFAEWSAEFDTEQEQAMQEVIGNGVFMGGFKTLQKKFGG